MILLNLPKLRQTYNYDCGAKVVESVLAYYGFDIRSDKIIKLMAVTKNGTKIGKIKEFFRQQGLKIKAGRMSINDLQNYINQKIPVIVVLQAWPGRKNIDWQNDWSDGHYVAAVGYTKDRIIFVDPSAYNYTYLTHQELLRRWHDVDVNGKKYFNFGLAIFGLPPKFKERAIIHMD